MPPPPGWMKQGVQALEQRLRNAKGLEKWRVGAGLVMKSGRLRKLGGQQRADDDSDGPCHIEPRMSRAQLPRRR